ncbi:DUF3300 domain-containing protein [Shewanella donghaensis]|uniref:DUF3300 domain-containing protein n=1 Tax=Shewanella donghaensis TaxID=238836 RepID=UPI001D05B2C6|nr:DUF3300 domain-containing protein [Shewanella donghaensis]
MKRLNQALSNTPSIMFIKTSLLAVCMMLTPTALATTNSSNNGYDQSDASSIVENVSLSEAQLAQMLAPIALYPDSLLTHILIAATYPLEVVQARRWEQQHSQLDSEQKMQQAQQQDWDPSVMALVAFPTVLEKLNEDIEWTQELGEAFLQDEETVLASIQTLRHQADEANSFDDMDNMTVTRVEKQIIIEPARTEVVYVPYYDPRIVYGNWRWHAYPPVYWHYPAYAHYRPHRPIYWGPSVYINFNYFFGAVHWSHRRVVVVNHHKSHYYRKPHKIAYSQGSQRWKHKPAHRRGVAYKAPRVSHKYDRARYNKTHKVAHSNNVNKRSNSSKHNAKPTQFNKHKSAHIANQQRVNKALKTNNNQRNKALRTSNKADLTGSNRHYSNKKQNAVNKQNSVDKTRNTTSTRTTTHKVNKSYSTNKQAANTQVTKRQTANRQVSSRQAISSQATNRQANKSQTARANNTRANTQTARAQQRSSKPSNYNRTSNRSSSHKSSTKQRIK